MTTGASEPPVSAAEGAAATGESQWALISRRFFKHRLAVAALFVLGVLYFVSAFADFFAPHAPTWRNLATANCPPQLPRFSLEHGLHVLALDRHIDPVTLRKTYRENRTHVIPIGFFVRGEPRRILGLLPTHRHFIGIDRERLVRLERTTAETTFYLLGADKYGQDIFSRLIHGGRVSLSVGVVAILVTFVLGIGIGGVSGYVGGTVDTFIQRVIEVVNSFPNLPLWLALGAILPPDWSPLTTYLAITMVLSLLSWTSLARVVRGKILALREEDYAVAARLLGASHSRILFRHLLPGFTSHIIVVLTLSVPAMILGETALSFLGLGLRPPIVSWGVLLQDCLSVQNVANYPWLLLPVVPIVVTVLSFNFLGDGLRDAADPYSSR